MEVQRTRRKTNRERQRSDASTGSTPYRTCHDHRRSYSCCRPCPPSLAHAHSRFLGRVRVESPLTMEGTTGSVSQGRSSDEGELGIKMKNRPLRDGDWISLSSSGARAGWLALALLAAAAMPVQGVDWPQWR